MDNEEPENIIDVTDETGAWGVTEMKCVNCGREWVAVHPADVMPTECPTCHKNPRIQEVDFNV